MQDESGKWREINKIEERRQEEQRIISATKQRAEEAKQLIAYDSKDKEIGVIGERPVIKISEPVTIMLEDGTKIYGKVSGFKGANIIIHTSPTNRPFFSNKVNNEQISKGISKK